MMTFARRMPTGLHCLLMGGTDYGQDASAMCRRAGMARSIAGAWSHEAGKGWQMCNTSPWECNRALKYNGRVQKCNRWKYNEWA